MTNNSNIKTATLATTPTTSTLNSSNNQYYPQRQHQQTNTIITHTNTITPTTATGSHPRYTNTPTYLSEQREVRLVSDQTEQDKVRVLTVHAMPASTKQRNEGKDGGVTVGGRVQARGRGGGKGRAG